MLNQFVWFLLYKLLLIITIIKCKLRFDCKVNLFVVFQPSTRHTSVSVLDELFD